MTRTREEQVAERAYQLYEKRGRREGAALDDWLIAEKELGEKGPEASEEKRPVKKAAATVKKAVKKTAKKTTRKKSS